MMGALKQVLLQIFVDAIGKSMAWHQYLLFV